MSDEQLRELKQQLETARMDIVALQLIVANLSFKVAAEAGKGRDGRTAKFVKELVESFYESIDNIEFTSSENAEKWRRGIKDSLKSLFIDFRPK